MATFADLFKTCYLCRIHIAPGWRAHITSHKRVLAAQLPHGGPVREVHAVRRHRA
jgi:hypothetical protein